MSGALNLSELKLLETGPDPVYRAILDALPVAVYTVDAEGWLTYFNPAAAVLAGRTPEIGKDRWCVSARFFNNDGSTLAPENSALGTALREGRPVTGSDVIIERPDGTKIPVVPNVVPLFHADGTVAGAVNLVTDISELKVVAGREHKAEQARQQFVAIVESSDDAIVSKNLDGVIVSWNPAAERLFGYTADEAVGKNVTMLIPDDHLDEEPGIIERIRRGERIEHYETIRRRKDGSLFDISITVSPVRDRDGNIIGASKIARDISGRKKSEQQLAERIEQQAALHAFTDRLHYATSMPEIHEAAIGAILRALGCDRASILMLDEEKNMRFVAWRGLSEKYRKAVDGHSPWPVNVSNPDAIYVTNVQQSSFLPALKEIVANEGIHALAFIPLISEGRLIGKFMAYYDRRHEFTESQQDLAITIARQLSFNIVRARAEEELRESERRLTMAMNAGKMGAWEWNMNSGQVIWSENLEAIHGLAPGTFGGTFEDFKRDIHPEDLPRVLAGIEQAVASGSEYHITYRMLDQKGRTRWLEAFGRFVHDIYGRPQKLAGVCMDVTDRMLSEQQRELMVAELSHRVKNTLATVISISRQSFTRDASPEDARKSFDGRIHALAKTHSRLAEGNWNGVSLETALADELAPYRREDGSNVLLSGPDIIVNPRAAVVLGMAFHELATNAAKYGALSVKEGVLNVTWERTPERHVRLYWSESGGPAVKRPQRSGFGRLLLERALVSDLEGTVELEFRESGLQCRIEFPLRDIADRNIH